MHAINRLLKPFTLYYKASLHIYDRVFLRSIGIGLFSLGSLSVFQRSATSHVNAEGKQLLRMHVVQRAQVWKLEQQLGESGGVSGSALADEGAKSPDETFLEDLY